MGIHPVIDDWGNVIGVLSGHQGPVVLFDAHMDTVGVGNRDQWHHSPEGEVLEGRLYGRGAVDMKGALAAMVHGVASLHDVCLPGTVIVCASVAEEWIEGAALIHVCKEVLPDYVIIGEATNLSLAIAQRGRAKVVIDIDGVPAHSSRPHLGVNAAELMVDVVQTLRKLKMPRSPFVGSGLLVLTDLVSSPTPSLSTIPSKCRATYDRRLIPGEQPNSVLGSIRDAVNKVLVGTRAHWSVNVARETVKTHTGVYFTREQWAPAWEVISDTDYVTASLSALSRVDLFPKVSTYSFCTNGSGSAGVLNIPTLGFGPGDPDLAHQIDESVSIDDLVRAARGYGALAREMMSMG
jgi:putative selenium metabolism hydrolase